MISHTKTTIYSPCIADVQTDFSSDHETHFRQVEKRTPQQSGVPTVSENLGTTDIAKGMSYFNTHPFQYAITERHISWKAFKKCMGMWKWDTKPCCRSNFKDMHRFASSLRFGWKRKAFEVHLPICTGFLALTTATTEAIRAVPNRRRAATPVLLMSLLSTPTEIHILLKTWVHFSQITS